MNSQRFGQNPDNLRVMDEAINSSFNAIVVSDGKWCTLYANPAFLKLWGYDNLEEVIGKPTLDFWSSPEKSRLVGRALLSHGRWDGEMTALKKDGSQFYAELHANAVSDGSGYKAHFMAICSDITARKAAEEAMVIKDTAIQSSINAILICDDSWRTIYANPSFLRLWGYDREEDILGKHTGDFWHREKESRSVGKALLKDGNWSGEMTARRRGGSTFPAEVRGDTVSNDSGYRTHFMITCFDITDRMKERKTRAALREKETLLKEIHHRVKNNLQVVSGLLNVQNAFVKNEEASRIIRESETRVRAMALIHEKLYQVEDLASVDLNDYIQSLTGSLMKSHNMEKLGITVNIKTGNTALNLDTIVPCGLILNELVSNIMKYAFPDGRKGIIDIDLEKDGDEFILRIADNGVGIPEDLDLEKSRSLGLSLVGNLVEGLSGSMEVNRTQGTAFTIRFREYTESEAVII